MIGEYAILQILKELGIILLGILVGIIIPNILLFKVLHKYNNWRNNRECNITDNPPSNLKNRDCEIRRRGIVNSVTDKSKDYKKDYRNKNTT